MKIKLNLEQCSAGWKVTAEVEEADVAKDAEIAAAQTAIAMWAQWANALPGWGSDRPPQPAQPALRKWGRYGR